MEKTQNLLDNLNIMIPEKETCEQRRKQIRICTELGQYYDGADALLKLKEMFQLTGEFSDIEKLAEGVSAVAYFERRLSGP